MFGEWGGLILQFTVTLVVVLGLIAVVYWLVRRYSAGGLGRLGRGRVPRLAVIDAMAVDGRRRLVLVRRDNVEHLILIGGPSDIVVEQAIQRPRPRPVAKPQPMAAPAMSVANDTSPEPLFPAFPPAAENPPIPFPQARVQQAAPPPPAQPAPQSDRGFVPLRRAAQPPPARPEPTPPPLASIVQFEPMAEAPPPRETPPPPPLAIEEPSPFARPAEQMNGSAPLDLSGMRAPPAAPSPFVMPASESSEDTAVKVNDLEREMARLLGEITAKRPS